MSIHKMMRENTTPVSEMARAKHNSQISIAKAIGIILMVAGHSGCPEYMHDFIYGVFYKLNY